jgi:hypothetical protein
MAGAEGLDSRWIFWTVHSMDTTYEVVINVGDVRRRAPLLLTALTQMTRGCGLTDNSF